MIYQLKKNLIYNNLLSILNNNIKFDWKSDISIIIDSNNNIHRNQIEKIIDISIRQKILFVNKLDIMF